MFRRRWMASVLLCVLVLPGIDKRAEAGEICIIGGNAFQVTITGSGTFNGTIDSDVILGSEGADTINGLGGYDRICGLGGNDVIDGGAEDDWIAGDSGDDTLKGGDGDDQIFAGPGNDRVEGGLVAGLGNMKGKYCVVRTATMSSSAATTSSRTSTADRATTGYTARAATSGFTLAMATTTSPPARGPAFFRPKVATTPF